MNEKSPLALEAKTIVRDLELLGLLQTYGQARLVGSVALDLVVKLDIDLHLLVNTPDLLSVVDGIYHRLLEREAIHEVRITDWRKDGGVKIGVDHYPASSGDWSIDIWVTDRPEATAFAFVDRLLRELQPEHRQAILEIKSYFHRQGLLRNGISPQIYLAVLDAGVRTVEDFLNSMV
jgi:hypothetical protein